ncbi:MAG: ParB/RepB/Spo0J family partition protein [bacterium]
MLWPRFQPAGRAIVRLAMDAIAPDPRAPRRRDSPEALRRLADSMRRYGQLSPVLVRSVGEGYELIAGQRRMKALKLLGRTHVKAIVIAANEADSALLALIENLHRLPLHYLDEAEACRRVLEDQWLTPPELAEALSISPAALSDRLRLLRLPSKVRDEARRLNLPETHARALLRLHDAEAQLALLREAAEKRWNLRQLEARIERYIHPMPVRPAVSPVVRDNRIIINAINDTVRELNHIGVAVESRVEEHEDHIDVVVTIPVKHGPLGRE